MSVVRLMWAIVAVLFLSGCYVEQSAGVKGFSSDRATPKMEPIRAFVTLDETFGNRETTIALDIEFDESEEGAVPRSIKINQLDSMGNPDPCPDILDTTSTSRAMIPIFDGPISGTRFAKGDGDLVVRVKINYDSQHLESLTITAGGSILDGGSFFSFTHSDNVDNAPSEGKIEVVENRELSNFKEKHFREDTSGSTSCDEEGSAPPENN